MFILRIIGYLILLAGLVALGAEIYASLEAGAWTPISLGKRWFEFFGAESILAIQNGLQRYVHPFLWDPLVQSIFEAPAWLPMVILGVIILLLARRRRQKRMFS